MNPQNQDLSLRPPLPGPDQTIRALHTRGMGMQHLRQKMGGTKETLRFPDLSRPRILLMEPQA